jgi:hypothetical protein
MEKRGSAREKQSVQEQSGYHEYQRFCSYFWILLFGVLTIDYKII